MNQKITESRERYEKTYNALKSYVDTLPITAEEKNELFKLIGEHEENTKRLSAMFGAVRCFSRLKGA